MEKRPVGDAAIDDLASRQHGLVTRDQALHEAGLSSSGIDRRLANGAFEAIYPRVYRLRGSPRSEWQKVLAVCLHGRKGNGDLARLVQRRRGASSTGSGLETKVLRAVRAAKLPTPVTQYPVFEHGDHPFIHLDFAWPDQKIALLPDGVGTHQTKRQ